MWWPLVMLCFIHMSGKAFCLLGENTKNPEAKMDPGQMISYWGYPSEMHKVIIADGYILQVYQIPHGKNDANRLGFIAFSTNPTLAEKIKVFYALAPVATVKYTQSLFNKLALIPHFLFKAVKSGRFQAFDWGTPFQNLMHYHQPTPPIYHLTAMNVPIAVWNGGKDLLADTQDVYLLLSKLSNLIYHKEIPNYNHLDFIWATDAPQEVYSEVVSLMAEDKK
ncbi:hypothetical protein G4228_011048 [Cervus hanglu yarkandensis]|nr:hypothetical protein G4228_011048 [Cervus hanglu yarkandensis]